MKSADFTKELDYLKQQYRLVVGIDEVGRGCWAGPLVSVAYRFYTVPTNIEVADSKTIGLAKRLVLVEKLKDLGEWGIGEVSGAEIDQLGLTAAQLLSYQRAVDGLSQSPDIILLDGRPLPPDTGIRFAGNIKAKSFRSGTRINPDSVQIESIVDGDALVASIAAASLLAKVHRDTYMKTIAHDLYPNYGFNSHVGYGTKQHQAALVNFGITPLHRKSYKPIQKYLR